MKSIITIVLVLLISESTAQYWGHDYLLAPDAYMMYCEPAGNNYILNLRAEYYPRNYFHLVSIDKNGEVKFKKTINNIGPVIMFSALKTPLDYNHVYHVGARENEQGKIEYILGKEDDSLNFSFKPFHVQLDTVEPHMVCVNSEGGFTMIGTKIAPGPTNTVFYRLDTSAILIERKEIYGAIYSDFIHDFIVLPKTNEYLITTDLYELVRFKTSDYSFVSNTTDMFRLLPYQIEDLTKYGSDGYLVSSPGFKYDHVTHQAAADWPQGERSNPFLYRYDEDFNLLKETFFHTPKKCETRDLSSDNLAMLDTNNVFLAYGSYYNQDDPDGDYMEPYNYEMIARRKEFKSSVVVIKTDVNGNLKWQKDFYSDNTTRNYQVFKVFATPDSGVLVISLYFDFVNDPNYITYINILKIDKDGNSTSVNELSLEGEELKLYPNPADDWINIPSKKGQSFYYTLVDNLGKEVGKGNSAGAIDVSNLPAGFYLVNTATGKYKFQKN